MNDIYQFSDIDDRMDILEHTLVCNHLAPTAPDTLGNLDVRICNLYVLVFVHLSVVYLQAAFRISKMTHLLLLSVPMSSLLETNHIFSQGLFAVIICCFVLDSVVSTVDCPRQVMKDKRACWF